KNPLRDRQRLEKRNEPRHPAALAIPGRSPGMSEPRQPRPFCASVSSPKAHLISPNSLPIIDAIATNSKLIQVWAPAAVREGRVLKTKASPHTPRIVLVRRLRLYDEHCRHCPSRA